MEKALAVLLERYVTKWRKSHSDDLASVKPCMVVINYANMDYFHI